MITVLKRKTNWYSEEDDDNEYINNIEDYLDLKDIKKMTKGDMRNAMDEEEAKAKRNMSRYKKHYGEKRSKEGGKKGAIIGAITGGLGGAALGALNNKGKRYKLARILGGAALGAGATAGLGYLAGKGEGESRGESEGYTRGARKGHDSDSVAKKLARKFDDEAKRRGDTTDFEAEVNKEISEREARRRERERMEEEYKEKRRQEAREDNIRYQKMAWADKQRLDAREEAREARRLALNSGSYSFNENNNNVNINKNNFDW